MSRRLSSYRQAITILGVRVQVLFFLLKSLLPRSKTGRGHGI
jgi:hypothetical protein